MAQDGLIVDLQGVGIQVYQDSETCEVMSTDWTGLRGDVPLAVVYPKSTEEVSQVMRLCSQHKVAVVPSGGRTGLAGGAATLGGELVLSLEKMDTVYHVDPVDMMIDLAAGVKTQRAQERAQEIGLVFPVDLAAKGSCHIGGNLATNAGGLKFIEHGGTREQVLGIEVVLADGQILTMGHGLRKNNTGYDLQGLFIGSEGTLGIITRAQMRLVLPSGEPELVCLGLQSFDDILKLLKLCCEEKLSLSAFEFFTKKAHEITLKYQSHRLKSPFEEQSEFYVLLEADDSEKLQKVMERGFEEDFLVDGVMSSSEAERQQIWALRESITESVACDGYVHKNDVSVRLTDLPILIQKIDEMSEQADFINIVLFGHIGDGNIHINYVGPKENGTKEEFKKHVRVLEKQVFEVLKELHGSISAEHGIGILKRDDLHFSRTEEEVAWMKKIKQVFDPQNILNPGKIWY